MYEITHNGDKSKIESDFLKVEIENGRLAIFSKSLGVRPSIDLEELLKFIADHKKQLPTTCRCDNCGAEIEMVGEVPDAYMCDNCIDGFIDYIGRNGGIVELLKKHSRGEK